MNKIYKNNLSAEHPELKNVIYRIACIITGKMYIGYATNFRVRMKKYIRKACKGQRILYKSLNDNGIDNHTVEILSVNASSMEQLKQKEQYYIFVYDTFNTPHGMNRTKGGEGTHGYKHTPESCKLISAACSGKNHPNFGKKLPEEHRKNMSAAKSGKNHHFYGKTFSEEHKQKISAAHLGEKNPNYGKTFSEATKQKMSAARKEYWKIRKAKKSNIIT